jgi:hypothetical protein
MAELFLTASSIQNNGMHLKLLNDKGEFISGENGVRSVGLWQKVKTSTMPKWMIWENMKQETMLLIFIFSRFLIADGMLAIKSGKNFKVVLDGNFYWRNCNSDALG